MNEKILEKAHVVIYDRKSFNETPKLYGMP